MRAPWWCYKQRCCSGGGWPVAQRWAAAGHSLCGQAGCLHKVKDWKGCPSPYKYSTGTRSIVIVGSLQH